MSFITAQINHMNPAINQFVSWITKGLMKCIRKYVNARQRSVNKQVAQYLSHTEYRNYDVQTIYEHLNAGTLENLD